MMQILLEQKNFLNRSRQNVDRLARLINDILDFSKIEAGKLSMESIDFDIYEVLSNVGAITAHKAQERGLELLMHKSLTVPRFLNGDSLRVGQILINLVGNNSAHPNPR